MVSGAFYCPDYVVPPRADAYGLLQNIDPSLEEAGTTGRKPLEGIYQRYTSSYLPGLATSLRLIY